MRFIFTATDVSPRFSFRAIQTCERRPAHSRTKRSSSLLHGSDGTGLVRPRAHARFLITQVGQRKIAAIAAEVPLRPSYFSRKMASRPSVHTYLAGFRRTRHRQSSQ